jgi:hypothetical protein
VFLHAVPDEAKHMTQELHADLIYPFCDLVSKLEVWEGAYSQRQQEDDQQVDV